VMLCSGDPVGLDDAVPGLLAETCLFAETRGLRVAFVGGGERLRALAPGAGLRSIYIGDEAIVATGGFSLAGRQIRKVRQSVNRLSKAGYTAELTLVRDAGGSLLDELDAISERWRQGRPERGFSMAMDSLRGDHVGDSSLLIARDALGHVRGFLHFVPSYGSPRASLSAMRRDHDVPNGLTEFMLVRAIERFRDQGIEELSLNFAAFGRLLHSPRSRVERVLGRLVSVANPFFQIESLLSFSAKFKPRWQPRYLLFESMLALPRTALATLWAEGQLPKPGLPRAAPPSVPVPVCPDTGIPAGSVPPASAEAPRYGGVGAAPTRSSGGRGVPAGRGRTHWRHRRRLEPAT
jgi:lysyl-tRNA synthetase, class II